MAKRTSPLLLSLAVIAASGCQSSATPTDGTPPPTGVSVAVAPGIVALQNGTQQQFTATVTRSSNTAVTWSVQEGSPAAGTVTTGGLYTAPSTTGAYHVVATSVADGSKSGIATVTVTASPPPVTVTLFPASTGLVPGGTQQFTATVTGSSNTAVTWSVQEGSPVAGTVTTGGLYTAPSTTGSYHVVATSVADPTRSGSAGVSVGLTSVTNYTPLAAMPPRGTAPGMQWLTGEIAIVRDVLGGDLVSLFGSSTGLHAAVSRDLGVSWSWVDPATTVNVPKPSTIHQDRTGKIHVGYPSASAAGSSYARIALTRDASGHATGFAAEVLDVFLPATTNGSLDIRFQIVAGRDQAGNDTIFYCVFDDMGNGSGRIQAGKTSPAAGLAPTRTADFVKLDDTAGATSVFMGGSNGNSLDSSHNNGVELAQHPVSRDLWFQWGAIDTGDTILANRNPVRRLRATPSGPSAWALGSVVAVEPFDVYAAELGSVVSTPGAVWMMRFSPSAGIVIDRADGAGNVTPAAIPSPHATAHSGGYVVLAVSPDERQAWAGGWISYDAIGGPAFWAQHWNGTSWERFGDTAPGDTWGVGRSVGWDAGLALVVLDPVTYAPSFATIRTSP